MEEDLPVMTEYRRWREKSLVPAGIQTAHLPARSLVVVPTVLSPGVTVTFYCEWFLVNLSESEVQIWTHVGAERCTSPHPLDRNLSFFLCDPNIRRCIG